MQQYLELIDKILSSNNDKDDRTGTGTISIFGHQMRFDLSQGFPFVTTKKMFIKGIIYELLWLLKGDTNVKYLQEHGVHIWDEWADSNGDLGPVYGAQWRNWNNSGIDQIANVVEAIKTNPSSRRHIVTAWNPEVLPDESSRDFAANVASGKAALPPCHCFFQFYVSKGKLSCQIYIRSNDTFLGAPFNIAEYALLTMMVADVCGLKPGELVYTIGDAHIYKNHIEQCKELLRRRPMKLPQMRIMHHDSIFDFDYDDFELVDYASWPTLKGEVSV